MEKNKNSKKLERVFHKSYKGVGTDFDKPSSINDMKYEKSPPLNRSRTLTTQKETETHFPRVV